MLQSFKINSDIIFTLKKERRKEINKHQGWHTRSGRTT